ncbi:hypothetical protein [Parvibaculum sp.]|uniref:hypothetical protein n=1 Tax=Parvibaculum sp. TaxID=2024848 RepID=UPI002C836EA9|nr:hypothetical protein [Parvibaculum sp.]HUD52845.1 hypothetical protein [Parvibaculum sp.]
MSVKIRLGAMLFCGMLVAVCPVVAGEIDDVYAALMRDAGNVSLNLRYARLAEGQGKIKWALPAYERVLRSDPSNVEAKAGLARVKAALADEG